MELFIACGMCGGDPATDGLLVQSALAAVISAPYLLRSQITAVVRRVRGVGGATANAANQDGAACSMSDTDDERTR